MVLGFERFAAEYCNPREYGIIKGGENLVFGFFCKGFTVIKRPGFRLETPLTSISATADKKGGAYSLAVGYIAFLYSAVIPFTPL